MCGGRKPEYEQTSLGVAKRRYGFAPVSPVAKGPPFACSDLAAVVNQTGAALAADDVLLQGKYAGNDENLLKGFRRTSLADDRLL